MVPVASFSPSMVSTAFPASTAVIERMAGGAGNGPVPRQRGVEVEATPQHHLVHVYVGFVRERQKRLYRLGWLLLLDGGLLFGGRSRCFFLRASRDRDGGREEHNPLRLNHGRELSTEGAIG